MTSLRKQIFIWCVITVIYFIAIFVPLAMYYRTAGDPPDFLIALHHEFLVLPLFALLVGKDFYMLSQVGQEIFAFLGGLIFYVGIGALLGLLQHQIYNSKNYRGLFYAILCSMTGYTIGAWIGGHPPAFMLLNPPIFFIGGYIFGRSSFRIKSDKNN
jgi:uncharacterized membrane protein YeaQ/YmgE (transglycosylase-associated protein family)